jgi:hypothetical protein
MIPAPIRDVSKVLRFWAVAFVILVGCGFLKGFVPPALGSPFWGVSSSLSLVVVLAYILHRDQQTWSDIGLGVDSRSGLRLAAGLGVGLGTYATTFLLVFFIVGPVRLVPGDPSAPSLFPGCGEPPRAWRHGGTGRPPADQRDATGEWTIAKLRFSESA